MNEGPFGGPHFVEGYTAAFQTEPEYVRPVWPSATDEQQKSIHIATDNVERSVALAVELGATVAEWQPQEDLTERTSSRASRSRIATPSFLPKAMS